MEEEKPNTTTINTVYIGENLLGQKPHLYVGMKIISTNFVYEVVKVVNSFTAEVIVIPKENKNTPSNRENK